MRHVTTTMRNDMSLVTLTHRVIDFHSQCVFNLSTVSIEIMSGPGDEVTFLKKTHQLLSDGRIIIRIHPKHLDQLCKLLHLSKRLQNKRSPGHSEIETPDTTEELNQHDASVYRSCIGILLYLSPDLPQCQYVIRYLSTCARFLAVQSSMADALFTRHRGLRR